MTTASGAQAWPRCLVCGADLALAEEIYRAQVQRCHYVPRSGTLGPRMVRAGQEALGGFAICAACWARLPGAR